MHEQMIIIEINKYIHEEIMGKCWHLWELIKPYNPNIPMDWKGKQCIKCSARTIFNPSDNIEDYCSDNSPRRLLSDVVEKVDSKQFGLAMWDILEMTGFYPRGTPNFMACKATAEQMARACVKAHKKGEKINV